MLETTLTRTLHMSHLTLHMTTWLALLLMNILIGQPIRVVPIFTLVIILIRILRMSHLTLHMTT